MRSLDQEVANTIWVVIEPLLPSKKMSTHLAVTDSVSQIETASM